VYMYGGRETRVRHGLEEEEQRSENDLVNSEKEETHPGTGAFRKGGNKKKFFRSRREPRTKNGSEGKEGGLLSKLIFDCQRP